MKVTKCDICGAVYDDMDNMREIQIRKRKNIWDNRPILEKTIDACINCVEKFTGEKLEEGNNNESKTV